jgi:branched-chain amino acid transport system substrate-binding protein
MRHRLDPLMPSPVAQALRKFGADIRIARVKRGLTSEMVSAQLGIHRSTYSKLENGDAAVGLGLYANALYVMGLGTPFADVADPLRDRAGLLLDLQRLPKRARRSGAVERPRIPIGPAVPGGRDSRQLKIGVVGTMSGPFALWGLACKYAALTTAEMYNRRGGVEIGGARYQIKIIAVDDRLDPACAAASVEHLTVNEGVRYIIGPNVEQTIASVAPVAERNSAMLFPYSFTRSYYSPPFENAVLGQIAGYQAWPIIYKYLRDERRVRSVGVLPPNSLEGQMQRRETVAAARKLGLKVLAATEGYEAGTKCFVNQLAPLIENAPDLIVLPNLAPSDAPELIRTARSCGFRGVFATEAAQDIALLNCRPGNEAEGLITLGGASTPESRSRYMDSFVECYCDFAGGWNDEAGTKAYALEMLLGTLRKAGVEAITDIQVFKKEIPSFSMKNPFVKANATLRYVGADYFGQKRQIGVPLVINAVRGGQFKTVMVTSVS